MDLRRLGMNEEDERVGVLCTPGGGVIMEETGEKLGF